MQKLVGSLSGLLLFLTINTASAVVPLEESFLLWPDHATIENRFVAFDIDPTTAGVEYLLYGERYRTFVTGTDIIETTKYINFKIRSADGKTNLGSLSENVQVKSGNYPDPGAAANQPFYDEETFQTTSGVCYESYNEEEDDCLFEGQDSEWARERIIEDVLGEESPIGFGIAETTSGDKLIVGLGLAGYWWDQTNQTEADFGYFVVYSFNATDQQFGCKINFKVLDGSGYFLEANIGSVGNYLTADDRADQDEIRIIKYNEDTDREKVSFFDPADCSHISTTSFVPPLM